MATEIKMPQLSDTMDKGTILRWFKNVGDPVSRGDALAEVATDKADLEVESFHEGTVLKLCANVGDNVNVGELLAVIGAPGEQVANGSSNGNGGKSLAPQVVVKEEVHVKPAPQAVAPEVKVQSSAPSYSNGSASDRLKISPLAKNIAKSHGVDYTSLSGSGEGGRIVKRDVEQAIGSSSSPNVAPVVSHSVEVKSVPQSPAVNMVSAGSKVETLSKMRATIASRMVESVTTAPHFYATAKVDVGNLVKLREVLKSREGYSGLTYNHLILKGAGLALRKYPRINSKYDNGTIIEPGEVNIGIITALPDGLLIPVVKNADALSVMEVVSEAKGLVDRARAGKPKADDLQGGTFSISNIGRAEVEHFTAIINPGQGAILAVSGMQDEPVIKDGAVVPGKTMRITLSVDHRIIDGVLAGEFLTYLKNLLEVPILLFA